MRRREPWIEYALKRWSDWVRDNARWQGWGSGVDIVDALENAGWGRGRTPGVYANPVLAELLAMLHAGQGRHARMHAEITGLPTTERRVLVARYCGRPVPVERLMRSDMDVPPSNRKPQKVCWLEYAWSGGPLAFAEIARLLGLAPSTCHDALARAKLRLQWRLEVRQSIRSGAFMPDGTMDPDKLEKARALAEAGETRREEAARAA